MKTAISATIRRIATPVAVAGTVIVMSLAPAAAQEATEECYPIPPGGCVEVGGVKEERPPQPAPEPQPPVVGGVQDERPPQPAPDEVAVAPDQLPRTGTDAAIALAAAIGLIGAGGYAVRRSRADRA